MPPATHPVVDSDEQAVAADLLLPPYVSYKTFTGFVAHLKAKGECPTHVDRSVMTRLSGVVQSKLLSALRFLSLIEADGRTTPKFQELVKEHGTEGWKSALLHILESGYGDIVHDIEPARTTAKALDDRFRKQGHVESPDTRRKCVGFYLNALRDAGVSVSAHLSQRQGNGQSRRAGGGVSRRVKEEAPAVGARQTADEATPAGSISIPIYLPGKSVGRMVLPENLTEADCDMINAMLRAYAKRRNLVEEEPRQEE